MRISPRYPKDNLNYWNTVLVLGKKKILRGFPSYRAKVTSSNYVFCIVKIEYVTFESIFVKNCG